MTEFPRTTVGGVSVSRMLIGTNWFLGYSHTSAAKDKLIREQMTSKRIAEILTVYLENGVDTIMGMPEQILRDAISEAQDRTGRAVTLILTPTFNGKPGGPPENEPERVFDRSKELGATFCMPHTSITDCLLDKLNRTIRDLDKYTQMIRERDMIPGLSTHMPETVIFADEMNADVETYIQIYNAAGFLMHVEVDWVTRLIHGAKKPVMTIKPMAAGRLLPLVGLAFVWSTLRDRDMVTVGTMTPDEAREVIEISLGVLEQREAKVELQKTRSKASLEKKPKSAPAKAGV
ncbi:MAG TPA: hypothetical protein VM492_15645 [Sumerlaeia bacterium]|nr:hypothetical protein [Sumerlaeia bacterium]